MPCVSPPGKERRACGLHVFWCRRRAAKRAVASAASSSTGQGQASRVSDLQVPLGPGLGIASVGDKTPGWMRFRVSTPSWCVSWFYRYHERKSVLPAERSGRGDGAGDVDLRGEAGRPAARLWRSTQQGPRHDGGELHRRASGSSGGAGRRAPAPRVEDGGHLGGNTLGTSPLSFPPVSSQGAIAKLPPLLHGSYRRLTGRISTGELGALRFPSWEEQEPRLERKCPLPAETIGSVVACQDSLAKFRKTWNSNGKGKDDGSAWKGDGGTTPLNV